MAKDKLSKLTVEENEAGKIVPSPTNIKGLTPQEAAADAIAPPKIKARAPKISTQSATGKATIWNPNTGEKRVINIGDPFPEGFSLFTGGTATGEEAQQVIIDNAEGGGTALVDEPTSQDFAAEALAEDEVVEEEEEEEEITDMTTFEEFGSSQFSSTLKSFGVEEIEPPDFSESKRLAREALDAQLVSIDADFDNRIKKQEDSNSNLLASLQANLIKAGVNQSGTSFQSATAGQIARADEIINRILNEKSRQVALARAGERDTQGQIRRDEIQAVFDTQVQNANNAFKKNGLNVQLLQLFNSREQSEKNREQNESQFAQSLAFDYFNLEQKEQEARLGKVIKAAEDGMLSLDEELLSEYESLSIQAGFPEGFITEKAAIGLQKRLAQMAKDELERKKTEAGIAKTKAGTGGGGGVGGKTGDKVSDFDKSRQFITDNPDASDEELILGLRENTKLSDSDINLLVGQRKKPQFITTDFLRNQFSRAELEKMMENAGFERILQGEETEINNFLEDILRQANIYREQGFNDDEINQQLLIQMKQLLK